jgi:alpha-glucosidase/oligosaccharide 4-alpha-D-glucosyltransferase
MRFGYHNEGSARTVNKFIADDIPLDAIVFDLYWFGKEVKGTMGNLAWDKDSFPNPEGMIADFRNKGVQTVVITEPFIVDTSALAGSRRQKSAGTDASGAALAYDFYFGHTGLIDIFGHRARTGSGISTGLRQQGVAGVWGDLGEPEVHPTDHAHASGTPRQCTTSTATSGRGWWRKATSRTSRPSAPSS